MSAFVVNPQTLEALQQAVIGLAAELGAGSGLASQYGGTQAEWGDTPSTARITGGQLNGADVPFENFFTHWQQALGQIGTNMENVANALANAAEYYAETDDNVCLANP